MSDNNSGEPAAMHRPVLRTATIAAGTPPLCNLTDYIQLGEILARSGYFQGVGSPAQAVVKMLAGAEMGFGPMAALSAIHFYDGKIDLGAHLRAATIKRSDRYDYEIGELTREVCRLEFYERTLAAGGEIRKGLGGWVKKKEPVTVTLRESVESGVALARDGKTLKANWARSPDDMLFARAVSKGFRRYCPDLTGGVLSYDPDELDALPAEPVPALPPPPEPEPVAEALPAEAPAMTEPAPEGPADPFDPVMLDTPTTDRLHAKITQLGLDWDAVAARLKAKYGKERLRQLTKLQARELETNLDAALGKRLRQPAGGTP
jgi:hypothetical protein